MRLAMRADAASMLATHAHESANGTATKMKSVRTIALEIFREHVRGIVTTITTTMSTNTERCSSLPDGYTLVRCIREKREHSGTSENSIHVMIFATFNREYIMVHEIIR